MPKLRSSSRIVKAQPRNRRTVAQPTSSAPKQCAQSDPPPNEQSKLVASTAPSRPPSRSSILVPPERPSSHPYLESPDLTRRTSGLFLTDRDVRSHPPRALPFGARSLSPTRSCSRPASPVPRAPSPLRHEVVLQQNTKQNWLQVKPKEVEVVHIKCRDGIVFDMTIVFRDGEKSLVETRNVPIMLLNAVTKQFDEWKVSWAEDSPGDKT